MPRKHERSNPTRLLLAILAGLLLLSAAIVWILQANKPAGANVPRATPQTHQIPRATLSEALQAWQDGSAVFVDVRGAQNHAAAHIPEARSIPEREIASRWNELDPDDWIITYCT